MPERHEAAAAAATEGAVAAAKAQMNLASREVDLGDIDEEWDIDHFSGGAAISCSQRTSGDSSSSSSSDDETLAVGKNAAGIAERAPAHGVACVEDTTGDADMAAAVAVAEEAELRSLSSSEHEETKALAAGVGAGGRILAAAADAKAAECDVGNAEPAAAAAARNAAAASSSSSSEDEGDSMVAGEEVGDRTLAVDVDGEAAEGGHGDEDWGAAAAATTEEGLPPPSSSSEDEADAMVAGEEVGEATLVSEIYGDVAEGGRGNAAWEATAAATTEEAAASSSSSSEDEGDAVVAGEDVGEEVLVAELADGLGVGALAAAPAPSESAAAPSSSSSEDEADHESADTEPLDAADALARVLAGDVEDIASVAGEGVEAAKACSGVPALVGAPAPSEGLAAPSSSSSEDEADQESAGTEPLDAADALARVLAGDVEMQEDISPLFSPPDGAAEQRADADAVILGEEAIRDVLQSSSSSSCSDDDATEAMTQEPAEVSGEEISDGSSLLALLGSPGDVLPERLPKSMVSELEQALLKDLRNQPTGAERLARAHHLGRWLKTKVGCRLKGAPGAAVTTSGVAQPPVLAAEDAKAMAIRLVGDAGGTEREALAGWSKWPGSGSVDSKAAATPAPLPAEDAWDEDESDYYYQPQHRESVPERSILKRRPKPKGKKRPRPESSGRTITMPRKKRLLRDVYEIESFRTLDLWFTCPGSEVVCDWCLCPGPQMGGRLQGADLRSQFAQCEFVCYVCLRAFGEV